MLKKMKKIYINVKIKSFKEAVLYSGTRLQHSGGVILGPGCQFIVLFNLDLTLMFIKITKLILKNNPETYLLLSREYLPRKELQSVQVLKQDYPQKMKL